MVLKDLRGLVVIDEIQHAPDLFKVLRLLGRRIGVEFKRSDAPELTPSTRIALDDLSLDALYVVYHGDRRCVLAPRVQVVPLTSLLPASTTA